VFSTATPERLVFAYVFLKEKLSKKALLGLVVLILGTMLLIFKF